MKAVIHTSNKKGKVTDTNNGNFEQTLLSNRTLTVVVPTMNPRIEPKHFPIVVAPRMLLTPDTEEVVRNAACGGTWVNNTPWQVIRTDVNGSNPGDVLVLLALEMISPQS